MPEPVRGHGLTPFGAERDPARVVAFSDAVTAIAVTLLVLEIQLPQDTQHLLQGLATLWPSYLAYVVTFLLIGQVWANHHVMFDHIRSADRVLLFLNTVLLMDIAFLPFAASVLAEAFRDGHGQRTAVVFYGLAFEFAAILFNVIWWYASHDRRLLVTTIDSAGVRAIAGRFRLALAWIAIGVLLGALLPILGVVVIAAFITTGKCRWPASTMRWAASVTEVSESTVCGLRFIQSWTRSTPGSAPCAIARSRSASVTMATGRWASLTTTTALWFA